MEHVSGNIFIRTPDAPMKQGNTVLSHRHNFDHTTYIARGRARIEVVEPDRVTADGIVATWRALRSVEKAAYELYNWVLITKGTYHRIIALEDDTIYHCIYSHRRADTGEVVEEYTGWMEAVT